MGATHLSEFRPWPINLPAFLIASCPGSNFNQRVLDEALDESLPLLERLKFLAITSSNLDEFFMVRVGGLQLLVEQGITTPDPSGMTPASSSKRWASGPTK